MKIKLFIKRKFEGDHATGLFELDQDHCLIGRKESDLKISDPGCSRQHALLYTGSDGRLRVKDLESTNGTFVRGRNVNDCALRVGDEIRIGDCLIVVVGFQGGEPAVQPVGEPSRTSIRASLPTRGPRVRDHYPSGDGKGEGRSEGSFTSSRDIAEAEPPKTAEQEGAIPLLDATSIALRRAS